MKLTITNNTGSTKTYLSGIISVAANSSITITNNSQLLQLSTDPILCQDFQSQNITLSDSTNIFNYLEGINYLNNILINYKALNDSTGTPITWGLNSSANSMPIVPAGDSFFNILQGDVLSSNNSSTANLAANSIFTGTSDLVNQFNTVNVTIKSDQNLYVRVEQSNDGTNWDISDNFSSLANLGYNRQFKVTSSYVRVLVLNQGINTTTYLRLQTKLVPIDTVSDRFVSFNPLGFQRVELEATQLFNDNYDTGLDITNRWNAPVSGGGGVAATNVAGSTALGTGTTANGYSILTSVPIFSPVAPGFLVYTNNVNIENPIITNSYRFWGFGNAISTPTATAPLSNAIGYEISTTGKLYAVCYSAGTRNVIQDLSAVTGTGDQPIDNTSHKYFLFFRGDYAYWAIDKKQNVIAVMLNRSSGPIVNRLPAILLSIAGSSAPASSVLLTSNSLFIGDTTGATSQISDGNYAWRKATVNIDGSMNHQGNVASLGADSGNPVKVGGVYNTTDPAPTNNQRIDLQTNSHGALAVQFRNSFRNVIGNATTTVKSGAGILHMVILNNNATNGSAVIYDNTAGSGTKMFTFNIGSPSGGLLSTSGQPGPFSTGPLGLEFSTGLTIVTSGSTSNDITLIYR